MLLVVGFALLLLVPSSQANAKLPAGGELHAESRFPLKAETSVVSINFDVANDNYASFQDKLREVLIDYPEPKRNVKGIPVLRQQRCNREPARWIHLNLAAGANGARTTIRVRDDNIYLVGFTNLTGQWYVFENRKHLLPTATPLKIKDDYGSLVKGHKNLRNLDLGKQEALQAVNYLSSLHNPPTDDPQKRQLGAWLAKLCVMIAEAERFNEVLKTVSQGWEHKARISELDAKRVVLWGKASNSLLNWQKTGKWVDTKEKELSGSGIVDQDKAMEILRCIIWPASFKFRGTVDPEAEAEACD